MHRPRLCVTRILPEPIMVRLRAEYDLTDEPTPEPPDPVKLAHCLQSAEALIATLTEPITEALLHSAPKLKVIANYAVGYNNIDLDAATRRGILVTNTPDVLTDATADLTWALLCAVARRLPEGHALVQQGGWTGWTPTQLLGGAISGQTLGIVGMGRIGRAVAERARGFRMPVYYTSSRRTGVVDEPGWQRTDLDQLLRQSDFVSLHVPLTADTHHLIGRRELALMRSTAYVINTSRGPVIDEAALVEALAAGRLAGAGLDVYEREPDLHPALRGCPQVVTLPHLGSATFQTRIQMGLVCLENISAALQGRRPPNAVN